LYEINAKCIASTSHDFRTPLSIIYTNLQLLEQHEVLLDKETRDDALLLSKMAVKSLVRVLDKTSIIDSINKNRLEYKPSIVNLHNICHKLTSELNDLELIPDRIIYLEDHAIGEVELDIYLFKQLFSNLILNALDFSRKQSKVSFESKCIDKFNVEFIIKDRGIGIDQKQVSDLEYFFNTDDVKITEGVGLGFIIAKECIRLQGGKIYIESTVGEGSMFTVKLPINSQ
jgi:signal transduction histidine kinase